MKKKILDYKDIKIIEGETTLLELILQTNEYKKVKSKLQKAMDFKELPINTEKVVDMFNVRTNKNFENTKQILDSIKDIKSDYLNVFNEIISELYVGSLEVTKHKVSEYFEDLPREYYWLMRIDIFLGLNIQGNELLPLRENFLTKYDRFAEQDYIEVRIYEDTDMKTLVPEIRRYKKTLKTTKHKGFKVKHKEAWYIYCLKNRAKASNKDIEKWFMDNNLEPVDYNYHSQYVRRGLLLKTKK
jgi:hypothetical protein